MKIPALLTLLLAALLAALPTRQAAAQDVSFDVFYNSLADDGDWYNTPEFGYVWHPVVADDANWRPYTDGYWAQTDDGWTWVSYESFGWATYHYGRWTRLKDIGWAWTPGYQWGPGWVSWRTSDEYVGWAPLPPRPERTGGGGAALTVDYNDVEAVDDGYTSAVDQDYDIGPANYCFVATPQFGAPVLARVLLPPQRNIVIFEGSRNVTNIYYRRSSERTVVYNSGPDFAFISGRVERPIQRLRLEPRDDVAYLRESGRSGGNPTVVRGGALIVAAPVIARRPVNFEQVKPVRIKQTIVQTQVVHGWSNAGGDPQQVARLRETIKTQAQAAPRQAKADLPPQNVAAPVEARTNAPKAGQEDADRVARRDEALREKAARDKARNNNGNNPPAAAQPFANGQNPAAENKGRSAEERDARRAAREQGQPANTNNPPAPAAATPAQDDRAARRAARQEREQQRAQTPPAPEAPAAGQGDAERAARRAERQQPQAAEPQEAKPAQPDRDARRAERQQQQQTAQPQQQAPQPDREARRAERQQQQQAAQPQQQAPQPDRDARRAERQQQQAQQPQQPQPQQPQPQQQQAQQQQAQQERAARRAERQQQPAQPSPQQGTDDNKKKHDN